MVDINSFSIKALTNNDDQFWRVDWFGYLSYHDKYGQRRSEPLIDIYLSAFEREPNSASVNYKTSTTFGSPNLVKVPISYLRLIKLGDVWRQGVLVQLGHNEKMLAKFDNINIDEKTTRTVQSGSKDSSGEYILPFRYHPYHSRATQTYCEVTNTSTGDIIVVPHYVILQTYFSCSQYVFQQLFKFGLEFKSIYDPSKSSIRADGSAYILLKKWTHDKAAAEVARLAFDRTARDAVVNMGKNFALQKVNQEPVRPKVKFPFSGITSLSVFGKWCPIGKTTKKAFIVYDILNCTASYPFSSLEFYRDNPGDLNPDQEESRAVLRKEYGYKKPKPKLPLRGDTELLPNEIPANDLEELILTGRTGTQFSDLLDKCVDKKRQEDHKEQGSTTHLQMGEEVLVGNTGDGDVSGTVASIDIQLPEQCQNKHTFDSPICRLALFQQLVESIRTKIRVNDIEFVQVFSGLGKSEGIYSFLPITYTSSGRVSKWQYINYFKGSVLERDRYHHRRALIAKISLSNGSEVYLIDIERRMIPTLEGWQEIDSFRLFLASCSNINTISNYQLSLIIEDSSSNQGKWNHGLLEKNIQSFSINHASNASIVNGDYLPRQIAIIEKHIGFNFG
ncbi:hypothetical protein [Moritella viscosa]|uniref:hypothetical protein n=1 Tax=Moritella viscosa TaxID=80854 RepID=UPI0011149916|nr:hypothetical protein [Moritella viscosa]